MAPVLRIEYHPQTDPFHPPGQYKVPLPDRQNPVFLRINLIIGDAMVMQHSIIMIKRHSPLWSLNDPIHIHMPNAAQDLSWIYKSNLVEVNGVICVTISASDTPNCVSCQSHQGYHRSHCHVIRSFLSKKNKYNLTFYCNHIITQPGS